MIVHKVVGIDLGTTNSVIAMMNATDTDIICYESDSKQKTIPSVVAYDQNKKENIAGMRAFNRRGTKPEPVVSIKRKMGTQKTTEIADKEYSPEQISAIILTECKKLMQGKFNKPVDGNTYVIDRAVITVPAYFAGNAKEATKKAGELAGLKVEEIFAEPTAAAVFYSWKFNIKDGNFMVYDLGGGTFDISIVRMTAGDPQVLGIAGNNFLGGDDFDRALAHRILERMKKLESAQDYALNLDLDDPADKLRFERLVLEAEMIKKALSSKTELYHEKAGLFTDRNGMNVNLAMDFTRAEFEELIKERIDSTISECYIALDKAKSQTAIALEDIDYILMVGGSTKIPAVFNAVKDEFCNSDKPHAKCAEPIVYEPDMAVGYGAAIQASRKYKSVMSDDVAFQMEYHLRSKKAGRAATMKGVVTAADGRSLSGCRITAESFDGSFSAESTINQDGAFMIENLPVKNEVVAEIKCRLISVEGSVLLDFVAGGVPEKEPAGVLSKSVNIDLLNVDTKETYKQQLLAANSPLPVRDSFTFVTNQFNKRHVSIKLYEDYTMIKQIDVSFEKDVESGMPVEIELIVSETYDMAVKGNVAGKPINVAIKRSADSVPGRDEYERKRREFEEFAALLKPGDKVAFTIKAKKIYTFIEEGYEYIEEQKIIEYYDKLCELIEEVKKKIPKPMKPPQEDFDNLARDVDKGIDEARRKGKNCMVSHEEVNLLKAEGHSAYDKNDQDAVTNCHDRLVQMKEHLDEIIHGGGGITWEQVLGLLIALQQEFGKLGTVKLQNEASALLNRAFSTGSDSGRQEITQAAVVLLLEYQKLSGNKPVPGFTSTDPSRKT